MSNSAFVIGTAGGRLCRMTTKGKEMYDPGHREGAQSQGPPPLPEYAIPKTSGLATASLVLGILGVITCGITAIVGLILGILGLNAIRESRGRLKGQGLATAGIVVSSICLVFGLLGGIMAGMLLPALARARDEARKVKCASNLRNIAQAMNLYLMKFGDSSMYAIPAHSFRGDSWLASLYWTGMVDESKVFLCPGTSDAGHIPRRQPSDLSAAGAVPADAVSYAGLCWGLTGARSHRNTESFSESAVYYSESALGCDDNEGSQNHSDGMNVVYFDSHVEFAPGSSADTYEQVGARGSPYEYLDSGED